MFFAEDLAAHRDDGDAAVLPADRGGDRPRAGTAEPDDPGSLVESPGDRGLQPLPVLADQQDTQRLAALAGQVESQLEGVASGFGAVVEHHDRRSDGDRALEQQDSAESAGRRAAGTPWAPPCGR